jgi:hypothetical protein
LTARALKSKKLAQLFALEEGKKRVKKALRLLLLVGLVVTSAAQTMDEEATNANISILNFNWKYAGYERAETVKGNESISGTDTSTSVKMSRKTIYVFKYTAKATLKNSGAKTIKVVYWDYVFRDVKEQKELRRYRLQSKQQILPGETQVLLRDVALDPKDDTRHLTSGRQSVEVTKIEYTDGSIWKGKQ